MDNGQDETVGSYQCQQPLLLIWPAPVVEIRYNFWVGDPEFTYTQIKVFLLLTFITFRTFALPLVWFECSNEKIFSIFRPCKALQLRWLKHSERVDSKSSHAYLGSLVQTKAAVHSDDMNNAKKLNEKERRILTLRTRIFDLRIRGTITW